MKKEIREAKEPSSHGQTLAQKSSYRTTPQRVRPVESKKGFTINGVYHPLKTLPEEEPGYLLVNSYNTLDERSPFNHSSIDTHAMYPGSYGGANFHRKKASSKTAQKIRMLKGSPERVIEISANTLVINEGPLKNASFSKPNLQNVRLKRRKVLKEQMHNIPQFKINAKRIILKSEDIKPFLAQSKTGMQTNPERTRKKKRSPNNSGSLDRHNEQNLSHTIRLPQLKGANSRNLAD